MKVLIVGASGLVGNALYRNFSKSKENYSVRGTYYSLKLDEFYQLDISDFFAVERLLKKEKPNVILLPAAISSVDYCEEHPQETKEVNVKGAKNLIRYTKLFNSRLVYFSSEYVFDGEAGPYTEEDEPHPINEYGRQKLEVENFIKQNLDNFLIIRTTVVYGWERKGKNFVMSLIKKLRNKETIKIPVDQISSPTYVRNLAEAVRELIEKGKRGIYNIVGNEIIDRYIFAKMVCKIFNFDSDLLIPITTEELEQKAKRPLKAGLKIDKARNELETKLVSPEEGLKLMKEEKICQV